jgi:hypothetical protein
MAFFAPSISLNDTTEPFELQVARGQIDRHKIVHVFGHNPDVDTNGQETIWTYGGILTHPSTALQMKVSSNNANDTAAGTGARTVIVYGLDANFDEVQEVVTLNGQTAVTMTASLLRVNSVMVASTGTDSPVDSNIGQIFVGTGTVTAGVPATVYGHIAAHEGQSLTAHYTVPRNYTAYIRFGSISSGTQGGSAYVVGRLKIHINNFAVTGAVVSLSSNSIPFPFDLPIKVNEKSCISATAETSANNEQVSASFQLLLISNTAF